MPAARGAHRARRRGDDDGALRARDVAGHLPLACAGRRDRRPLDTEDRRDAVRLPHRRAVRRADRAAEAGARAARRAARNGWRSSASSRARRSRRSRRSSKRRARARLPAFREAALVTHRGLSGPAILQVSSYWQLAGGARPGLARPAARHERGRSRAWLGGASPRPAGARDAARGAPAAPLRAELRAGARLDAAARGSSRTPRSRRSRRRSRTGASSPRARSATPRRRSRSAASTPTRCRSRRWRRARCRVCTSSARSSTSPAGSAATTSSGRGLRRMLQHEPCESFTSTSKDSGAILFASSARLFSASRRIVEFARALTAVFACTTFPFPTEVRDARCDRSKSRIGVLNGGLDVLSRIVGPELSNQACPLRHPVPRRHRERHRRAFDHRPTDAPVGPAGHRRQPGGRLRLDRRGVRREVAARRLHAAPLQYRAECDFPVDDREDALRASRFRADHAHRHDAQRHHGAPVDAVQVDQGPRGLCEGEPGQAELRRRDGRHLAAPVDGVAQAADEVRHRAHSL